MREFRHISHVPGWSFDFGKIFDAEGIENFVGFLAVCREKNSI
jgi:hypothetical protein